MDLIQRLQADRKLLAGQKLAYAGRFEEAIARYDEAANLIPRDLRIQIHRALALSAMGRREEAIAALRRATIAEPSAFVYPLFEGIIWYDAGLLTEARRAFTRASSLDPTNELAKAYLALIDMASGSLESGYLQLRGIVSRVNAACQSRVLLYCEQYLLSHQERAEPLFRLVAEEERRKRRRGALSSITDLLDRGLLFTWYSMAKALARLRFSMPSEERRARILLLEGARRYELDDYEGARTMLEQAAQWDPTGDEIKLRLADLHLFAGEYEAALAYLKEVDEGIWQVPYLEMSGIALYYTGCYEQADERFTVLVTLQPKEYLPAYYLGLCQLAMGEPKEARHWFERAVSCLNPAIARKRLDEMMRVWEIET